MARKALAGLGDPARSREILTLSVLGVRRSFYPQSLELRETEIRTEEANDGDNLTLGKWP